MQVQYCVRKIPQSRKWPPSPVFLPGKFHGHKTMADYSLWCLKELDMTEYVSMQCKPRMAHGI